MTPMVIDTIHNTDIIGQNLHHMFADERLQKQSPTFGWIRGTNTTVTDHNQQMMNESYDY